MNEISFLTCVCLIFIFMDFHDPWNCPWTAFSVHFSTNFFHSQLKFRTYWKSRALKAIKALLPLSPMGSEKIDFKNFQILLCIYHRFFSQISLQSSEISDISNLKVIWIIDLNLNKVYANSKYLGSQLCVLL